MSILKQYKILVFTLLFFAILGISRAYSAANRQLWVILGPHQDVLDGNPKMMQKYDNQIKGQIDLLLSNPRIKYAVGNTWNLIHFVRKNPGYLPKIKMLMERESFTSSASWTGFESVWFSGEYIQRNVFYSKKFLKKLFNYDSHWIQFNDVPSYTPQTPQILAKSDVKLMMIHNLRMHYAFNNIPYLNMVGMDGSKVLTSTIAYDELLELLDFLPVNKVKGAIKNTKLFNVSMVQAISDWGVEAEASRRVIGFVGKWNKEYASKTNVNMFIKTPEDFVDFALKKIEKNKISLDEATGICQPWPWKNYGNAFHMSLFASAENLLPTAEKLSSICEILGIDSYPSKKIVKAWENLLCFSDHNASSSYLLQSYCKNAYETSKAIISDKMYKLGSAIKFSPKGIPILFFNPLNWSRKDAVSVEIIVPEKDYSVVQDKNGKIIPSQVLEYNKKHLKILIEIDDIPPLGYKTYYLTKGKEKTDDSKALQTWENHIENAYFSLDSDNRRGVFRIYDKKNGRDILKVNEGGEFFAPEARMFHYRNIIKKWEGVVKPIIKTVFFKSKVVESGPLRAVIRTTGVVDACTVNMDWIIYKNLDRLDINVVVDKKYNFKKLNSLINLPFNISNDDIRIGVAYGSMPTRKGEVNKLRSFSLSKHSPALSFFSYPYDDEFKNFNVGTWSLTFQKWLSIQDGDACLVVAQKFYDSRFARNGEKGILIGLPLTGVFPKDKKDTLFKYYFSIKTETGDWKEAKAPQFGWEVNTPIVYKDCKRKGGKLMDTGSFMSVEPSKHLVLTTFKKNFDKDGYTIRFFENIDEDVEAAIKIPANFKIPSSEVSLSSMLEKPQTVLPYKEGEEIKIPVKGFGVETIGFFNKKMTDITPPSKISDLKIARVTSNGVTIRWKAPGDDGEKGRATRYNVRFSEEPIDYVSWADAKPYGDIKKPAKAGTGEKVTLTGLKSSTKYFVAIRTLDEKKNTSPVSNILEFSTEAADSIPPAMIADLRAKALGSSAVRLDWTAPGDDGNNGKVSGYRIYAAKKELKSPKDFKAVKYAFYKHPEASGGRRDYFKVVSLKPESTYYFYLVSFDEAGNSSPPSEFAMTNTKKLQVATIFSSQDTTISAVNEEEMKEVFGKEPFLRTWDVRNRAILISFDLSKIPKKITVAKASINLYNLDIVYARQGKFTCYPVSRRWDARFANWKKAGKNFPWRTRGGDLDFSGSFGKNIGFVDEIIVKKKKSWVSLDITYLLKEWLSGKRENYGVLISGAPECEFIFCSSEYKDLKKRPFLEVTY